MMIRTLDIILSTSALLVLVPLLLPIVVVLRLTGEGEIFYLQTRLGKELVKFKVIKFATMLKNSPNMGPGNITLLNDPRVLPFGKWLRKTKINELPQLINVVKGEMSIIGPRPQTEQCFNAFSERHKADISQMKPGLAGVGSIVFRDEEALLQGGSALEDYDAKIGPYKGELEAWYLNRQKLSVYIGLIFVTVWVILFPKSQLIWRLFKTIPKPPDWMRKVA